MNISAKHVNSKKISAAARASNVSEQALSKSIAALERELGFKLFLGSPRGIELTAEGEYLYPKMNSILDGIGDIEITSMSIKADLEKQHISLGCYEGFMGDDNDPMSVRYLTKFRREHPSVLVEIVESTNEQIMHRVQRGIIDIGVFVGEVPSGCEKIQIASIKLAAVIGKKKSSFKKEKHLVERP